LHELILDLCHQSRPDLGLRLSDHHRELLRRLQAFSEEHIYRHERLEYYRGYAALVLESLFDLLIRQYDGIGMTTRVNQARARFPQLMGVFAAWLVQYAGADDQEKERQRWANPQVYRLEDEQDYRRCAIHFLSGMTDAFALKTFAEVTTF
jgi:dGTPase